MGFQVLQCHTLAWHILPFSTNAAALTKPPTTTTLLNTVYKIVATFTFHQVQQRTFNHSLFSHIQRGGHPRRRCANHIYHLNTSYVRSKSSYSLYIGFNKAFISVRRSTLWTVLEHSNLSRAVITSVENLYVSPVDAPIINGNCLHSYVQARDLCQGCPLSPLLFSYFLATTPPPPQGRVTSHHAFIDDIFICSQDPSYMQRAITFFDTLGRLWGLCMNFQKTEIQAMGQASAAHFHYHGGQLISHF